MKLVVISHKTVWRSNDSPSGYATIGGFPFQMAAISELFNKTTVMVPLSVNSCPNGAHSLTGNNLRISPLPEPIGQDLRRKLALLTWLPQHLPKIWRAVQQADVVHTPVPGDIGTIGILVALLQRKRLFVRHCGTWGNQTTVADRFLNWLLPQIAADRNMVLATGGGNTPPSASNPNIRWIFSTSLSEADLMYIPVAHTWQPGKSLKMVTVGRLTVKKNAASIIRALPILTRKISENPNLSVSQISFNIVGDGYARPILIDLAADLGVENFVTFHGNVSHDEVLRILSESHLFVFPTCVKEGFPKAVLEALACGLPVIGTNISVIPHIIRDSGYVLTDASPETIARAVLHLLENPEEMREMSQNARQTARQYTLERWRDEIGEQLQNVWGVNMKSGQK